MMDIIIFFDHPSWWGIGLAIVFGVVWLVPLALRQWRLQWLWLLLFGGVILFAPSLAWIQGPLQNWAKEGLIDFVVISHYLRNDFPLPVAEYRRLLPPAAIIAPTFCLSAILMSSPFTI